MLIRRGKLRILIEAGYDLPHAFGAERDGMFGGVHRRHNAVIAAAVRKLLRMDGQIIIHGYQQYDLLLNGGFKAAAVNETDYAVPRFERVQREMLCTADADHIVRIGSLHIFAFGIIYLHRASAQHKRRPIIACRRV